MKTKSRPTGNLNGIRLSELAAFPPFTISIGNEFKKRKLLRSNSNAMFTAEFHSSALLFRALALFYTLIEPAAGWEIIY